MKRVRYCDRCQCDREVTIVNEPAQYMFRKEPFEIIEEFAKCSICGEKVSVEELDTKTLQKLRKMYEAKHEYNPENLKEIRLQFNLSQHLFSKVVNMGIASIKRYEGGGSSPDSTQLQIYKLLKNNPRAIKQLFEQNQSSMDPDDFKSISEKLAPFLVEDEVKETTYRLLDMVYKVHENTEDNGYSGFNAQKLFQMVLFFGREGVQKTKLMKLLFYSDFLRYKRKGISISGTPYWHLEYGPVPKNHDLILGSMESMNLIDIREEENNEGFTRINIIAKEKFNPDLFTNDELEVIHYVDEYFKNYGSRMISHFAHDENGWKETGDSQSISYHYAETLQLN